MPERMFHEVLELSQLFSLTNRASESMISMNHYIYIDLEMWIPTHALISVAIYLSLRHSHNRVYISWDTLYVDVGSESGI